MTEITVKIQAPELVDAIHTLSTAIAANIELLINGAGSRPVVTNVVPAQSTIPTEPTVSYNAPAVQIPSQTEAPAPPAPPAAPAPAAAVPTTAQTYTMEQLAVAATQLVDAGRREELVQLLQQFGVQALTALPKEQYGSFATALRQMGAKI